eukprot:4530452-Amphidinium_carterae.1
MPSKPVAEGASNKRSALELLLYSAVEAVLAGKPSQWTTAAPKHEDAKVLLLLTQDVLTYILHAFVLDMLEQFFANNLHLDHNLSAARSWRMHAAGIRSARSSQALRLWDFEDFHSQHKLVTLTLGMLHICERFESAVGMDSDARSDKMEASEWLAFSFSNVVLSWGADDQQIAASGISSGIRPAMVVNPHENESYEAVAQLSFERIHGYDPVGDEACRGDDVWSEVK